nr:P2X purinoceptor 7-like [Misgurnus anguillicaudatus]
MKVKLQSLEYDQKDKLLNTILTRLPGLMFDVMAMFEIPHSPDPVGDVLHWCTCTNCREMTTDLERLCCKQTPANCISNSAHMEFYVLDEGVLRLARAAWNDIFAVDDSQEPGVEQRQYRHAAYRQYVLWQHGRLGVGNRVVIPSCCVWKVRIKFPDPRGQYTGFRVRRLE